MFWANVKMKSTKGFTLIELLVVIAIIALLMSVIVPSLKRAKETAKRLVCGSNMKSSGTGFAVYANENDDELPLSDYMMPRKDGPGLFYLNSDMPFRAHKAMRLDTAAASGASYPDYVARWSGNRAGWNLNGKGIIFGLGMLYDAGIIADGKSLYCPSVICEISFQVVTHTLHFSSS